jgi:hypothetical protein
MNPSRAAQPDPLVDCIRLLLIPYFVASGADRRSVEASVGELLSACSIRSAADLLTTALIIAFSMSAMNSMARAAADDLAPEMRSRLCGAAIRLSQAGLRNQKAMQQRHAESVAPMAEPPPARPPAASPLSPPIPSAAQSRHATLAVPEIRAAQPRTEEDTRQLWANAMAVVAAELSGGKPQAPDPVR